MLIEQEWLEIAGGALENAVKPCGRDAHGVWTESPPTLMPQSFSVGKRPDTAEPAWIAEYKHASVI